MLVKSSCSNVFNKILRILWETGGAGEKVSRFASICLIRQTFSSTSF